MELEGLRGIAAVAVVLGHFLFLFFPALRDGDMSLAHTRFEDNIHGSPLGLVYAATFAVAIFFVLSGFVLSIGYFQTRDEGLVRRLATDRYLRLMLPALASVMIAWLLISLGAGSLTSEAGEIANSRGLAMKWRNSPGFFESLKTGAYDIFIQYKGSSRAINHVLWTMYIEFIGSFIVFLMLLVFAKSRYRWVAYAVIALFTTGTWFLGLVLGVVLADAYSSGLLDRLRSVWFRLPVAALALFLGNYPKRAKGTVYEHLILPVVDIHWRMFYLTIASVLVIITVLLSPTVSRLFASPILSTLGRYTFSLYLTHLFVIYTVSAWIVITFSDPLGYPESVVAAFVVSVPVFALVSVLFEKFIDRPSIRLSKRIGQRFRESRAPDGVVVGEARP